MYIQSFVVQQHKANAHCLSSMPCAVSQQFKRALLQQKRSSALSQVFLYYFYVDKYLANHEIESSFIMYILFSLLLLCPFNF